MLRPHQEQGIEQLRHSIRKGNKRIVLAAPCSFGKTRVAVEILKNVVKNGKKGIFICDRIKLVQQALAEFDRAGITCGVMQGDHWRTDPNADIQIASVQTLCKRRYQPIFHVAIIDECHTHYKYFTELMEKNSKVIFIGLSATPYSKGLGKHYQDLIVPITTEQLLDQEYLCPVKYYGGSHVNLKGIKTKRLSTGGSDYDPASLAKATEDDQKLVGDIIENFKRFGKGQTIAFSPSIKTSKKLVQMFREAGITAEHIDGYMDDEERRIIYESHDEGDFQVLSCSQLLNTGYDAPKVQTLIDLKPTKSLISYIQRAGRIMRLHPNKTEAIYLDHAGNVQWHGFPESIVPETLDSGDKTYNERELTKEKKEPELSLCPQCFQHFVVKCACGYERPPRQVLKSDSQILKELKKANRETSKEEKSLWLGQFQFYARKKGYKPGWASFAYRSKFGVWPNAITPQPTIHITDEAKNYIKHLQIKRIKSVS
jgi:superfamily II DNA or RNA helicase